MVVLVVLVGACIRSTLALQFLESGDSGFLPEPATLEYQSLQLSNTRACGFFPTGTQQKLVVRTLASVRGRFVLSPFLLLPKRGLKGFALPALQIGSIHLEFYSSKGLKFLESGVLGFLPKLAALEYQSLWLLAKRPLLSSLPKEACS